MFSRVFLVVGFVASGALARMSTVKRTPAPLTIDTPSSLTECVEVDVKWEGGISGFGLFAVKSSDPNGTPLHHLGSHSGHSSAWQVSIPSGTSIQLKVVDSANDTAFSGDVVIKKGGTGCLHSNLGIDFVTSVNTCEATELHWEGGNPPYTVHIAPGNQRAAPPLQVVGTTHSHGILWGVSLPANTSTVLAIVRDVNGEEAISPQITVDQGFFDDCASTEFKVNTPSSLTQCEQSHITWEGGISYYTMEIFKNDGTFLHHVGTHAKHSTSWDTNVEGGTTIKVKLTDRLGKVAHSGDVYVHHSANTTCLHHDL